MLLLVANTFLLIYRAVRQNLESSLLQTLQALCDITIEKEEPAS
ncbi:MAG: hypothetical protein ACR2PT_13040 [Endozoicomonas sp.]